MANNSSDILKKNIGMSLVEFFVKTINKNVDVCLFGFGKEGKDIYACMCQEGVVVRCICDNNWVHISDDIKVISPEAAVRDNPNALFVISSRKYCYDMQVELLHFGVSEEQIVSFNSSIVTSYRGLLPERAYKEMVSAMHYEMTGIYPNLNNPKTFNEKMLLAMVAPPMPLKTLLADKFKVRSWVADKIGDSYLVPLIGSWRNVGDIPWEDLPPKYVIKLNHGCGFNIISDGGKIINREHAAIMLKDWKLCNFGFVWYERQYVPMKPCIICEEYMENQDNEIFDYKFFCFHGEPKYIMFLSQRKRGLRMLFLDLEWNALPFVYSYPRGDYIPPKPDKLDEMIDITKVLCKDFDQVRVDWYVLNDGTIKFGEMTFTSAAGHAAWNPSEWDLKLGDMW